MGSHSLTIPADVWAVVETAQEFPFSVKSNYARAYASGIAAAASMGWLTTQHPRTGEFGRVWRITLPGLLALQNHIIIAPPPKE